MENDTTATTATIATTTAGQATAAPELDYKALYEAEKAKSAKIVAENANLDKYNKDLKEKYQAKLSDDEKAKQAREEEAARYQQILKENQTYKMKSKISEFIKDNAVADEAVALYVDGDIDGFFGKISVYLTSRENGYKKQIQDAQLQNNPTPPPAASSKTKNWREYSMEELNDLQRTNPAEYQKILNLIK